ncbi:hypothetical protein SEA_PATOS_59 [Gordonia phage Patos]|uniref:Uncharacterized protein n=1 Tax=Gordonia phage Patos TaxID=2927262 RepID=A0A9E7QQL8_9CAUD|nr:hypothetical protein SEA_PATOS_59 [Gordonia phage Patos]WNN95316.1 hypothetical protein SEA_NORMANRE_59 [Gordonia phage NorManre]
MTETITREFQIGDYVRISKDHIAEILAVPQASHAGHVGQITELHMPGPVPIVQFSHIGGEYIFSPDELQFIARPLYEVARDIVACWKKKRPSQATIAYAGPYVEAIAGMRKPSDSYGLESGDMIIAYLLNNLRNWRGEDARRIKAELNRALDAYRDGWR